VFSPVDDRGYRIDVQGGGLKSFIKKLKKVDPDLGNSDHILGHVNGWNLTVGALYTK
jgi:hypothetical protein